MFAISPKVLITSTNSIKEWPYVALTGKGEHGPTSVVARAEKLDDRLTVIDLIEGDWPNVRELRLAKTLPSPGARIYVIGYDGYRERILMGRVTTIHNLDRKL